MAALFSSGNNANVDFPWALVVACAMHDTQLNVGTYINLEQKIFYLCNMKVFFYHYNVKALFLSMTRYFLWIPLFTVFWSGLVLLPWETRGERAGVDTLGQVRVHLERTHSKVHKSRKTLILSRKKKERLYRLHLCYTQHRSRS